MHQRLEKLMGTAEERPLSTTFHAFCIKVLHDVEHMNSFRVIDENERTYFFNQAAETIIKSRIDVGIKVKDLAERVAREKQHIRGPHQRPGTIKDVHERLFQQVYKKYQSLLSRERLWDFEDLIFTVVTKLNESPGLVKQLQYQFKYIFVDEYQDINFAQYCIIKHLAHARANLCVIGDPDQSIYGFRGSDAQYFNRFSDDYPKAHAVSLSQNYRSVKVVLEASQQMMGSTRENRNGNKIFSKLDGPESIGILPCENERTEAVAIGKEIENMVGGLGFYSIDFNKTDTTAEDYSFSDAAVLFRTTRQGDTFADVFQKAGIPFQIASKDHLYTDKGVGATLSFLKIMEKTGSYLDMERVIQYAASGLGTKTVKTWKKWAFENNYALLEALENTRRFPVKGMQKERQHQFLQFIDKLNRLCSQASELVPQEKINFILANTTIREKGDGNNESLEKLIEQSNQCQTIKELCQAVALQTDTDLFEENTEKVTLMTMHASKGLEFPVVFISGCEEGYLPFKRQGKEGTNVEEERRLLYVAMTRAKRALYLSYAKKRSVFGKKATRKPSRFIRDIEQNLKNYQHQEGGPARKKGHTQLELFST